MDQIYIVDPVTKKLHREEAVSFADIGIKERSDLEAWIIDNSEVLGEELLILTSEYNRFDKSSRRLDVLALDKEGVLVVVELKLDLSRSHADQQAIRYAAFCSTMIMSDAVKVLAAFQKMSESEAAETIKTFLNADELPELDERPRIILAAGSLDDQELTATVLWLRSFGLDISCVELAPYRLTETGKIVLVPRVIIPIPEAREYQIQIEQKEAKQARDSKTAKENRELWRAIADEFNARDCPFKTSTSPSIGYFQIPIGRGGVHYEWMRRKASRALDVCLHFESPDVERNQRCLAAIQKHEEEIKRGIPLEYTAGPLGKRWTEARFRIDYDGSEKLSDIKVRAADMMVTLIERTHPIVEQVLDEEL